MSLTINSLNCCKSFKLNESGRIRIESGAKHSSSIKKSRRHSRRSGQKILLLGTGESGKSTFLKQMRIITGKSFSDSELQGFKSIIYDNIYKGVLFLLQARSTLDIPWGTRGVPGSSPSSKLATTAAAEAAAERLEEHFRLTRAQRRERALRAADGQVTTWTEEEFLALAPLFQAIWADSSIRAAFDQRNRLVTEDFSENTRYYLNHLHRIAITNYVPTDEDIVWSRRPTDYIVEEEILVHGTSIVFIDVGGQTKERRKWCQTFTDMNSILFLVGSSHYDELYLDRVTGEYRNKLREAMTVFEGLINFESFRRASIIIFFNKSDLLKEKIESRRSGIRAHFPEFPANVDEFNLIAVQNFLVESFASLVDPIVYSTCAERIPTSSSANQSRFSWFQRRSIDPQQAHIGRSASLNITSSRKNTLLDRVPRKRTIYRHFTTAVDKRNIQMVFNAMQDTILQSNLRRLMMN